jgi:hypothetical protein
MNNRTTNERFAKRSKSKSDDTLDEDDSIMSMSDFDNTSVSGSEHNERTSSKRKLKKTKPKSGCIKNCWKMFSHTKVVPQTKLYNYLAERSSILTESEIRISNTMTPNKSGTLSDNSGISQLPSPFSQGESRILADIS